jgi:hypothetical protein
LCWLIWRSQNSVIFYNVDVSNFMQVILMVVHLIQEWSLLLPEDQRDLIVSRCEHLLMAAQDFYSRAGWQLSRRLIDALLCCFCHVLMINICINPT